MSDPTSNTLETPFSIGETFWRPVLTPQQLTVPCPVCSGEKVVTVIIGQDERLMVECDACGLGYEHPRGVIEEWVSDPGAAEFVIEAVESFMRGEWTVRSTTKERHSFASLCRTESEALAVSVAACATQAEENMRRRQHHRGRVSKATWSVQYHRAMIKDLERQLAWHRAKIDAKKDIP